MICRHCGATLPPIAMFCGSCGRSVAARTPVVPPVVLTAAAPVFSAGEVLSITPATPPEPPEAAPVEAAETESAPEQDDAPALDAPAEPGSAHDAPPGVDDDPVPPARADAPAVPAPAGAPPAAPPVCASCGTEGERDDLFCAECGEAMPQDTRVIERLEPAEPAERAAPPLPGWASLLAGSSAPATSGPAAQSTAASAVVMPGHPAPAPDANLASAPAADAAPPAPPVEPATRVEPVVAQRDERPLPPLAPPPRLDPDVESTRLVPRSATGSRFVLQFSTGESYTVVGSGLIGRNPRSEPGEVVDHLVTIVDPGRSVSKTHVEFGQDSGVFFISDRHSGNGTIIREPGAEPRYAEPGRRYRVVRGTRVDLGEQFVVIS